MELDQEEVFMNFKLGVLLILFSAILPCTMFGQEYVIDGIDNAVFLSYYNPIVVLNIGGDLSAELISSNILVYPPNTSSLMEQVIVFQSSHNNPCKYFWPLTKGRIIQLRPDQIVKICVPRISDSMIGSAMVRIGSEVFTVSASLNAVPVTSNGIAITPSPGLDLSIASTYSNLSLTGNRGGDRDLDKILITDSQANNSCSWIQEACVGGDNVFLPSRTGERAIWAFIVDHGMLDDNSGEIRVSATPLEPVSESTSTWGGIKALYR